MITTLRVLFATILVSMIIGTVWAGNAMSLWAGGAELMRNPWGVMTLADAYFGFLTFYVWVAWKETKWIARIFWFIAIMLLGNIAMSAYVLRELFRIPADGSVEWMLLSRHIATAPRTAEGSAQ